MRVMHQKFVIFAAIIVVVIASVVLFGRQAMSAILYDNTTPCATRNKTLEIKCWLMGGKFVERPIYKFCDQNPSRLCLPDLRPIGTETACMGTEETGSAHVKQSVKIPICQ